MKLKLREKDMLSFDEVNEGDVFTDFTWRDSVGADESAWTRYESRQTTSF